MNRPPLQTINTSMPHSAHLSTKSDTLEDEAPVKQDSSAEDIIANGGESKKRKRRKEKGSRANGVSKSRRRLSVSKPARDPRDEAAVSPLEPLIETRSPSPVIDFDGLSRPSMC